MVTTPGFLLSFALFSTATSLSAAAEAQPCLFGTHLVDTARYGDLKASFEKVYNEKNPLPQSLARKYRIAMGENPDESIDSGDFGESSATYWVRTLRYLPGSSLHEIGGPVYEMILSDPGDNIAGGIFLGDELMATVGDGEIGSCRVEVNPKANRFFKVISPLLAEDQARVRGDYFGKNLLELERIAQFTVGIRRPDSYTRGSCYDDSSCSARGAAYTLFDSFAQKSYYLDVDAQGNGRIVTKQAPHYTLAEIKDRNILEASASFHAYKKLPWFYTN